MKEAHMQENMGQDFFAGIKQVDVWAADKKVKLPIFYRKARAHMAIFPASLFAVRKLLPDPRFVPAQMLPGIGAVALASFEYYDTDIGPYNEFAFNILLNSPQFLPVPGYNLTRQLIQFNFYPYIRHLPVTTGAALRWGIDYSGFPKFLASIDFEDRNNWTHCTLAENGELICRLSQRKIAAPFSRRMKFLIRLYQDHQPQTTEFKVNALEMGFSLKPGDVTLELGERHQMAREISGCLLSRRAVMSFSIPSVQFVLYGPENISLPLMNLLVQQGMRIPLDSLKKT
jgi:hypothetical protein